MSGLLISIEDRQSVEEFANHPYAMIRRRAKILLLYDDGLETTTIAEQVGLAPRSVRYWRQEYRQKGMSIFVGVDSPADVSIASPVSVQIAASASSIPDQKLTFEELFIRYPSDQIRAAHVAATAEVLFEATHSMHRLGARAGEMLKLAAKAFNLGDKIEDDPLTPKRIAGIFRNNNIVDLDETQRVIISEIISRQRGKLRTRRIQLPSDTPLNERDVLTLITLLRVAISLDESRTHETHIQKSKETSEGFLIIVDGAEAQVDAMTAQRNAALWGRVFHQGLLVMSAEQADLAMLDPSAIPFPEPMKQPGVVAWDPLAEAGRKILRYNFAEMLAHEQGTRLGEDIEELHDMRVAVRRMRVAFEIFQGAFSRKPIKPYLNGLRSLGSTLGRVRDLDVFMQKAGFYLQDMPADQQHGLDPLLEAWQAERETARIKMLTFLDSERYKTFLLEFNAFLHTPGAGTRHREDDITFPRLVKHEAPTMVYNRLAGVRGYERILAGASIEDLHALRIEFKRLRYTMEYFQEVLGEEAKSVINEIKTVQDHLGDLNDADVACEILSAFLEEWEEKQQLLPLIERQNPEPIVAYMAAKHAERHRLMVTFEETWVNFDKPGVRRDLALAISVL